VRRWVESKEWRPDTERTAIAAVRQVLNWGVKQKIIRESQLTGIEMPTGQHRDFVVSPWLHVRMMAKATKQGRVIIEALRLTGCRPNEIRAVRIEDVAADYSCFVLRAHKNARKTGKARTVYLSSGAKKLFQTVIADRKEGFVFLDRHGKQFTQNAIRCIFRRLREKLKLGEDELVNSYSFRHTWATNALMRGIPVATVAELMGNSVKMVEKHYGHLAKQPSHLLEMMERAGK
jgi:integrase